MADDAAELEAEEHARRAEVEHHQREVPVLDRSKFEVSPGSRNASRSQPDVPHTFSGILRRYGCCRSALAVSELIEITSPPVSTTK